MSRCVPNWDLDDDDAPAAAHPPLFFLGPDLPTIDSEVAELTWENGQLSLHGLGQPRLNSKLAATAGAYDSIMNQAAAASANQAVPISGCKTSFCCAADLDPWFNPSQAPTDVLAAASGTMVMDALVPCAGAASGDTCRQAMWVLTDSAGHGMGACGCCSTRVGSCSAMGSGDRLLHPAEVEQLQGSRKRRHLDGGCGEWGDHQSARGSATFSHRLTTQDTNEHERELDSATSEGSLDSSQSGKIGGGRATDNTTDEHDSIYSRPLREEEKRRIVKSSLSTKRSRAAAIHNQSERKRRDKINQKMKTLQKLVPNSSKTDKASMLDEVIDYLKQLQAQVQLMGRMNMMPPMMLQMALQQQLQMSMIAAPMPGLGLAGIPGIMSGDMSTALGVCSHPNIPGIPPVPAFFHPLMPMGSWDGTLGTRFAAPAVSSPSPIPLSALLASQPPSPTAMALDAYSRLAAIYQQQQPPQNP